MRGLRLCVAVILTTLVGVVSLSGGAAGTVTPLSGRAAAVTGEMTTARADGDGGQAADGSVSVRLVDAAEERRDDPRARIYIDDHVRPGTLMNRHVEVSNNTGSAQDVELYVGPATIRDGEFVGTDQGAENELTRWTALDLDQVHLQQGASVVVRVRIVVPTTASAGERYGVIWASIASPEADDKEILVINRVGVRIYLSVGPGGEPASDFTIDRIIASTDSRGRRMVTAAVTNTGGRALDLTGSLVLADGPGGLRAGPFTATTPTTLGTGQEGRVLVPLDPRIPAGPWRAKLNLHSGLVTRSASATITFPAAGQSTSYAPDRPWYQQIPRVLGLGLLLLLALAAMLFVVWRRRGRRTEEEPAAP